MEHHEDYYKSASTQVSFSKRLKLKRGKLPQSAIMKIGSRLIEVRELASDFLKDSSSAQTESGNKTSRLSANSCNTDAVSIIDEDICNTNISPIPSSSNPGADNGVDIERRRRKWRNAKRRRRAFSWYVDEGFSETSEQRTKRLKKLRKQNALIRQRRSDEDWIEIRKKHQIYKNNKLNNENNNQRFWRLILRRQRRRNGYDNLVLLEQYHRSIGKYGLEVQGSVHVHECADKDIKNQINLFYELLHEAQTGKYISFEKTKAFGERGIHLPENFYKDYLDDEVYAQDE